MPALSTRPKRVQAASDQFVAAVVDDVDRAGFPRQPQTGRQERRVLASVEPAGSVQMKSFDQARSARAELRRQSGQDLESRRGHHRAKSELRGWPRHSGKEQRLGFLGGHTR